MTAPISTRYTMVEHKACGWRWWSDDGRLQEAGACPSCGDEQPEMTVHHAYGWREVEDAA